VRQFHDEDALDLVWANVQDVGGAVRVTLGVNEPVSQLGDAVGDDDCGQVPVAEGDDLARLVRALFAGPSITTGVVAHLLDPAGQRTANPIMSLLPRRGDDRQPTRACPQPEPRP
jgi:hypothetical protein